MPARPPSTAPTKATTATTTAAIMLMVFNWPSLTGMRGKLFRLARILNRCPATMPSTATTIAAIRAQTQTMKPCLAPLKRAIRPATYPPQ